MISYDQLTDEEVFANPSALAYYLFVSKNKFIQSFRDKKTIERAKHIAKLFEQRNKPD
jgi:hypothetical protein